MQVSHTEDHATHAVISANVAREVTMSADAALMHMLSSLIYKNPMLAMVREVMCNAWDAHIDAGITDRPILVTLSEGKLIIRDYGFGIHDDMIAPIYGVYGGSTKRGDSMSTGGFGIGCKSPWSYVDYFQVTSYHKGTRWIYTMSKASPETGGKPNITPIVSMPTTETGLEVEISIKSNDVGRIRGYIQTVAKNSGQLTLFKDGHNEPEVLPTHPYSKTTDPFLVYMDEEQSIPHKILIKYGTVVYPVTEESDYFAEYKNCSQILDRLENRGSYSAYNDYATSDRFRARLVLIAPPNSLSLTPSREELSLQGGTIPTIKTLLEEFTKKYEKINPTSRRNALINQVVKEQKFYSFSDVEYRPQTWNESPEYILSRKDFIERLVYCNSKLHNSERERFYIKTIQKNKGQNPLVYAYIKAMEKGQTKQHATIWLKRNVTLPMERVLKRAGLDTRNLYLLASTYMVYSEPNRNDLIELNEADPVSFERCKTILNNMVILTHRQVKVEAEANAMLRNMVDDKQDSIGALVYVVPRKKEVLDKAREVLSNLGKLFIDLTVNQEKVAKPVVKDPLAVPVAKVAKPPKLPGFGCLSEIYQNWETSSTRVTNPRTVLVYQKRKEIQSWVAQALEFYPIRYQEIQYLMKGKVGLVSTEKQLQKAVDTFPGLIPVRRLLLEELINQYPGKKRMSELTFIMEHGKIYNLLKVSKKIAEALELPPKPTEKECAYYALLEKVKDYFYPRGHVEVTLCTIVKNLMVPSWEAEVIAQEMNKVPLLEEMLSRFRNRKEPLTPSQDEALYEMFNLIYKEFRSE